MRRSRRASAGSRGFAAGPRSVGARLRRMAPPAASPLSHAKDRPGNPERSHMLLFLRLSGSGGRQQHIAEDEQNGENVHQYRKLFRLAAGQLVRV